MLMHIADNSSYLFGHDFLDNAWIIVQFFSLLMCIVVTEWIE